MPFCYSKQLSSGARRHLILKLFEFRHGSKSSHVRVIQNDAELEIIVPQSLSQSVCSFLPFFSEFHHERHNQNIALHCTASWLERPPNWPNLAWKSYYKLRIVFIMSVMVSGIVLRFTIRGDQDVENKRCWNGVDQTWPVGMAACFIVQSSLRLVLIRTEFQCCVKLIQSILYLCAHFRHLIIQKNPG